MKIAIIGAGILGRLITFELLNSENNFELSLFDQNKENDIIPADSEQERLEILETFLIEHIVDKTDHRLFLFIIK